MKRLLWVAMTALCCAVLASVWADHREAQRMARTWRGLSLFRPLKPEE